MRQKTPIIGKIHFLIGVFRFSKSNVEMTTLIRLDVPGISYGPIQIRQEGKKKGARQEEDWSKVRQAQQRD